MVQISPGLLARKDETFFIVPYLGSTVLARAGAFDQPITLPKKTYIEVELDPENRERWGLFLEDNLRGHVDVAEWKPEGDRMGFVPEEMDVGELSAHVSFSEFPQGNSVTVLEDVPGSGGSLNTDVPAPAQPTAPEPVLAS